jgi:hypothetical protein
MGRAIGAEILRALRSNEMAAQAPKSRYRLVTPNAAVGGRVAA